MYFITYYLLVIIAIFLTLLLVYIVVNSSKPNSKTLRACARLYKGIMYFASNIFFLPIIRFFLSIFSCSKTNDIHVYATGFVCWKGIHYIHISIGMIFLCFYLAYSFMFQATFFETAMQQSQPIGKFTSNCEVVMLIEKASYLVFFQFLSQKIDNWITIILLIAISSLSLIYYNEKRPHYNEVLLRSNLLVKSIFVGLIFHYLLEKLFVVSLHFTVEF